jgi:ParB-like chromosome segregation protein Spo0J
LKIEEIKLDDLKPYEKNPRNNENAVKYVEKSIKQFGFNVPLVIDKNNVIVCGHTRYLAAQNLNLDTVPCIKKDNITEKQIKAFRIADNKIHEKSEWDLQMLKLEIDELKEDFNFEDFGFLDLEINDFFEEKKINSKEIDLDNYLYENKNKVKCPECGCEFESE